MAIEKTPKGSCVNKWNRKDENITAAGAGYEVE